jgi:hypothetical protein
MLPIPQEKFILSAFTPSPLPSKPKIPNPKSNSKSAPETSYKPFPDINFISPQSSSSSLQELNLSFFFDPSYLSHSPPTFFSSLSALSFIPQCCSSLPPSSLLLPPPSLPQVAEATPAQLELRRAAARSWYADSRSTCICVARLMSLHPARRLCQL